jgi:hypothetical protein
LQEALRLFDWQAYAPEACRAQAERFSTAAFRHKLLAYLDAVLA